MPPVSRKKQLESAMAKIDPEAPPAVMNPPPVSIIPQEPVVDAPLPVPKLYCKGSELGPLTAKRMRSVLGWENEDEYKERMKRENPDMPSESHMFITDADIAKGYVGKAKHPIPPDRKPDPVLLTDHKERRVVCWLNDNNRPFDIGHCKKLCQEILTRRWAGPTTMPGQTINGESIITSWPTKVTGVNDLTPIVINGQHTGGALILAWELWNDDDEEVSGKWRELWPIDQYPDGPVIDKAVWTGISPDTLVVRTLDNTKPRSLADTIYTSDVFVNRPDSEKKLASRMLSAAIDFLWARLRVGNAQEGFLKKQYQTHATSHDWLARHPKLLKCVEHLFVVNDGRSLNKVKLSAGECAAIMYIQASSNTEPDNYYGTLEEPDEKPLKWDLWDMAAKFWFKVADASVKEKTDIPNDKEAADIRKALIEAVEIDTEDDEGNPVQVEQKGNPKRHAKMVVLSKAWALYKAGKPITQDQITPSYRTTDVKSSGFDAEGQSTGEAPSKIALDEESHFGGIDLGDVKGKDTSAGVKVQTPSQLEEAMAKVQKASTNLADENTAKASMTQSPLEKYMKGKQKYGKDRVLIFLPKGGKRLIAYNEDADILGEVAACSVADSPSKGIRFTHQAVGDCDEIVRQLLGEGHQVAVITELSENEDKVSFHNPIKRKLPKAPPMGSATTPNPSEDPAAVAKKTRG